MNDIAVHSPKRGVRLARWGVSAPLGRFGVSAVAIHLLLSNPILLAPLQARADLRIVPWPRSVDLRDGMFRFGDRVVIAVPSDAPEDRFAAGLLEDEIEAAAGGSVEIVPGRKGDIVLTRTGAPSEVGPQGYQIEVLPEKVSVEARTGTGLFYGVQTLRQIVQREGIPAVAIRDWPAMEWRGLQDDIARGPVPTLEALKRRIQIAAEYKINLYGLYMEAHYEFRSHPLIAPPGGALSETEVRDLVAFAERHHVTLLPEQQSFGHLARVLKYERYSPLAEVPYGSLISPANPASYDFLGSLYAELAPLFPGPFVHVCGDEVGELGTGRTKAMVEEAGRGRVYVKHLQRLSELLGAHGKRTMVWGDGILQHPELIEELPPQIVVATWEYTPRDGYEDRIKPFRAANLDVFVCPGVHNWKRVFPNLDLAIPNIRRFTHDGQKHGAIGQLNCTWDDGGDALFGTLWYPILYGAAAAWQEGDCDVEAFRRAFDWSLFRNAGDEVLRATDSINVAHALLLESGGPDANVDYLWANPFRNFDPKVLKAMEWAGPSVRRAQEHALELIGRARGAARRNGDLLDAYALAARRNHFIGTKLLVSRRVRRLYAVALEHQRAKNTAEARAQLAAIKGLLHQGLDYCLVLRDQYQASWLTENRRYMLNGVLTRFDKELDMWSRTIEVFDELDAWVALGRDLTPAERLGLGE